MIEGVGVMLSVAGDGEALGVADAGGSIVVRATSGGTPPVVGFRTDMNGYPILSFKGGKTPAFCEVRILLAESARA